MLDTFAKRLASQLRSSPGDIDGADRWAIGGHFRPSAWNAGSVAIALGALASSFTGTYEGPAPPTLSHADRVRLEQRPSPGPLNLPNRYAIAGHYLFEGDLGENRAGVVQTALGALAPALRGTSSAVGAVDGRMQPTLGGLAVHLLGSASATLLIDLEWALTPTVAFESMAPASGSINAALGAITMLLTGTTLPPDSRDGVLVGMLGGLSTAMLGTSTPPPGRAGFMSGDFNVLLANFAGSSVPPSGVVGELHAALGGLAAALRGSAEVFHADGAISMQLDALTTSWRGFALNPGADLGFVDGRFGALRAAFRGYSIVQVDVLLADRLTITPALGGTVAVHPALDATPELKPL